MRSTATAALAAGMILAYAGPAAALQPLAEFVAAAKRNHPRVAEAEANAASTEATAVGIAGRSLPSITVRGSYTRNQYAVALTLPPRGPKITISPANQLGATGTLTVPLIDLATFVRVAAAGDAGRAVRAQQEATLISVAAGATQAYYQLVANVAVVASAEKALDVAATSLNLTRERLAAGTAATLEADRAEAEHQQRLGEVAAARLQVALSARQLTSATGIVPVFEVGDAALPLADDLHPEPPCDPDDNDIPSIVAAQRQAVAQAGNAAAQKLAWLPTINGTFVEQATNASGFTGHDFYYAAAITAMWTLDVVTFANMATLSADAAAAKARADQARRDGRDAVYRFRETIVAGIARSRAAREQVRVTAEAARLAAERFAAGTTTQFELLQAQRDAFTADIARIQADADLVNARAQLRYAAGLMAPP